MQGVIESEAAYFASRRDSSERSKGEVETL